MTIAAEPSRNSTKNGIDSGRAHRGALRSGNHAEYTVIERLLGGKSLEGSTLYVTLEPCTLRHAGKAPCVERVVSARVARVLIGMPDPNPDIQVTGIAYLLTNRIEVDFFDSDLMEKIREENREFIEYFAGAVVPDAESLREFPGPSEQERTPVPNATVADLSTDLLTEFVAASKSPPVVSYAGLLSFCRKHGLVVESPGSSEFVPTVAGLLLFGNDPETFLVQSKIKMEVQTGTGLVLEDVVGPILQMPDKVEVFMDKHMKSYTEFRGMRRVEVPEYPLEALREAVINAIAHRDYQEGRHTLLRMAEGKVVIRSPGLPVPPLSLTAMRSLSAPPYSRNPRIANTLSCMELMEQRGRGLRQMRDVLVGQGLPEPEFDFDTGYFAVTIYGREHAGGVLISQEVLRGLSERQRRILGMVVKRGQVSGAECAAALKISLRTVEREIAMLKQVGVLESEGKGRSSIYVLKPRSAPR